MNTQPEALAPASALANELDHQAAFHESQPEYSSAWVQASRCRNAAALLRTQHADIERLGKFYAAWQVWQDKTEWVQEAFKARELGMHRADVLKARIERKDALLRQALKALLEHGSASLHHEPQYEAAIDAITKELAK